VAVANAKSWTFVAAIVVSIVVLLTASVLAVALPSDVILREFISIFVEPFYTTEPLQVNDDVPSII